MTILESQGLTKAVKTLEYDFNYLLFVATLGVACCRSVIVTPLGVVLREAF